MGCAWPCHEVGAILLHLLTSACVQGRGTFLALLKNWFWCVPCVGIPSRGTIFVPEKFTLHG